ncbi:MAG: gamma-glutamyltransferase family protein [Candidatus Sumerlaeia bacterium]|nr:gamma-glutamyltransferase family protein [Candidatus Sumerlaeia bacterium]
MNWTFPHPSRRMPLMARRAVATSQPLAVQAGLEMMRLGGNAVDAAVASAAALTVLEPNNNGLGSDAFALVWAEGRLYGLNSSGRSPISWTPERFAGHKSMPLLGWDSVTVPGAVAAWAELSARFGRLDFSDLLRPAVTYAREGFHVAPITAAAWESGLQTRRDFPEFVRHFSIDGRAPRPGDLFQSPDMAASLEKIAATKGAAFYTGDLAESMVASCASEGGAMSLEDLANHRADWVEPVAQEYRHGYTLHEIPPNGQGLAALLALGIFRELDMPAAVLDTVAGWHGQIEAMKLALADAYRFIADPDEPSPWRELLRTDYLASRASLIDPKGAGDPSHGNPLESDTVYLTSADDDGMMVSFIQSNFYGFGSGIVVPGTGISMQNRGFGFSLEPGHPNRVGPGKRPFHTIIPGFVTRHGEPAMSFGVMGGSMQAQGHFQMMNRLYLLEENPQAALDAPRWRVGAGRTVQVDTHTPPEIIDGLRALGHDIQVADFSEFGGGQIIHRNPAGGYVAASDPRKDGCAGGW